MPEEDEKLVMLGLKQATHQANDAAGLIGNLRNAFGEDYDDFLDEYTDDNPNDFDDFESFLNDNEVEDAGSIRATFESRYAENFDEFDDDIRSYTSYIDLENAFGSGNELRSDVEDEDGNPAAGFKVYDSAGVGRNGQSIPEGGVEIYGREVYFSSSFASPDTDDPGDEDDETTYQFSYSNLEVSNTTPIPDQTITVSCSVTNASSRNRGETVQLYVDDEVDDSTFVSLGPVDTTTVEFEWSSPDYKTVEIGIASLPPVNVTVTHPSL